MQQGSPDDASAANAVAGETTSAVSAEMGGKGTLTPLYRYRRFLHHYAGVEGMCALRWSLESKSMSRLLIAVSAALGSVSTHAEDSAWITFSSDQIEVRAMTFANSGVTWQEWEEFAGSKNVFGKGNKFFHAQLKEKKSGRKKVVPMIPVDQVFISPTSSFVVFLSRYTPTDGVVILDRAGEVVWKEFGVCLSGGEPCLRSDHMSTWFTPGSVVAKFSSSDAGVDCLLDIELEANQGREHPRLSVDICKRGTSGKRVWSHLPSTMGSKGTE